MIYVLLLLLALVTYTVFKVTLVMRAVAVIPGIFGLVNSTAEPCHGSYNMHGFSAYF